MRKLLLSLMLLSAALLLLPKSSAQYIVTGQGCGASGLSGIANDGTPVVCKQNAQGKLVWVSVGGSNNPTISLPGPVFNVKDPTYGAVGDTKFSKNCTTASSSKIITNADNPWTAADVGKFMEIIAPSQGTAVFTPARKIASFQSAGQVTMDTVQDGGATPGTGQWCKWFTQDDTAAWKAATAAARTSTSNPVDATPGVVSGYSGAVACPPGGYTVSGTIFHDEVVAAGGNRVLGVSLIAPSGNCVIYPTSTFVGDAGGNVCFSPAAAMGLVVTCDTYNTYVSGGIWVEGSNILNSTLTVSSDGLWGHDHCTMCNISNVRIQDWGMSGGAQQTFQLKSFSGIVDNLFVQNSVTGASDGACLLSGGQHVVWRNSECSNHAGASLTVINSGARNSTTDQVIFEGQLDDECTTSPCTVIQGSVVNWIGGGMFGGNPSLVSVDGTSALYLSDANIQTFGSSAANANDFNIASGGFVEATGTTMKSNGTGVIVTAPAGATFVDAGGNTWQNCLNGTCNPITATDFATHGFSGGIVPKAAITHTPNTCYAVTGNLLATAQNLCIILLDQNYQLLTIAAQSGGTTPANSACATPPVITFSDGTRSATMTMTTGKTQWFSNVDSVTNLNQVFASGATLTVSIGANTCATPPANVSVNYDLQSVLNP